MKINTYNFLINNNIVHVKVDKLFLQKIKRKIIQKYSSLRKYNLLKLKICYGTLKLEFNKNKYFKFNRLVRIAKDLDMPKEEVFSHIKVFFARGSSTSRELILAEELPIDEQFVEGYALYLAEGDNGSNGHTIPRKVRFTNSYFSVLKHFQNWLIRYFPNNSYYFKVFIPYDKVFTEEHYNYIKNYFNLYDFQIKTKRCKWKRKTGFVYRICCDQAILIDLILYIESTIKKLCLNEKDLATSYIRGMMAGEGTVYFNKSRYVRIEMKNKKEIDYIYKLLKILNYQCRLTFRKNRPGMWSIYIGANQLRKFHREIGFGAHRKRENILKAAVGKKLRVNQYC